MTDRKIKILAIDDDPGDLNLLRRHLAGMNGMHIDFIGCGNAEQGLAELENQRIDLIFLDYNLGAESGLNLLQRIKESAADVSQAIIMITGQGDEEVAVEALQSGASDYISKSRLCSAVLERAVRNSLEKAALVKRVEEQRLKLERLARHDELTGLFNRRELLERLGQEMIRAHRYGNRLSLLMIDLDHFKRVNDTYGHIMGDLVLSTVAGIIRKVTRDSDIPGRLGGEEFCVVIPETGLEDARVLAERLRRRVAEELYYGSGQAEFHVTCSIGIADIDASCQGVNDFIGKADRALYSAKDSGRNRIAVAPCQAVPEASQSF